jgi:hypothetical protein
MPGHPATLRPGLHSEQQRRNFADAARRFWFGTGADARRCGAPTRTGTPCRCVALRRRDRCSLHLGCSQASARRVRLLEQAARGEATPEQAERAGVRAAANRQRVLWRRDPWAPGVTLDLGDAEGAMAAALRASGHEPRRLPPAVLDGLRWRWRRAFLDGRRRPEAWAAALAGIPGRLRAAGPAPPGWRPVETPALPGLVYDAAAPAVASKRRDPDRLRVPGRAPPQPPLGAMSAEDAHRAAVALALHAEALAPALASVCTDEARQRIALAFVRLSAGEIDHWTWLETLERLKGR